MELGPVVTPLGVDDDLDAGAPGVTDRLGQCPQAGLAVGLVAGRLRLDRRAVARDRVDDRDVGLEKSGSNGFRRVAMPVESRLRDSRRHHVRSRIETNAGDRTSTRHSAFESVGHVHRRHRRSRCHVSKQELDVA